MGRARLIIELEVEAEIALDGRSWLWYGCAKFDLREGEVGCDVAVCVTWQ